MLTAAPLVLASVRVPHTRWNVDSWRSLGVPSNLDGRGLRPRAAGPVGVPGALVQAGGRLEALLRKQSLALDGCKARRSRRRHRSPGRAFEHVGDPRRRLGMGAYPFAIAEC